MSTKPINVQKGECKQRGTGEISLTAVFFVALAFLIIGIWLPTFYWIGVVLMWVVFVGVIWRVFIRRECADTGTRISLTALVIIAIMFLIIGIWWYAFNIIGIIFVVIALVVFIARIVMKAGQKKK